MVLTSGRAPQAADEVVLGKTTLTALHAKVGDRVPFTGSKGTTTYTVVGEGFVPAGPHNEYSDGGWLTPAGYDSIFTGFKYRIELITLRPGARGPNAGGRPRPAGRGRESRPQGRRVLTARPDR